MHIEVNLYKEVDCMATKSILKTISIKDKKTCSKFIKAMEKARARAASSSCQKVQSNVQYREPKASEIKDLFG